jgi:hypothetical protein
VLAVTAALLDAWVAVCEKEKRLHKGCAFGLQALRLAADIPRRDMASMTGCGGSMAGPWSKVGPDSALTGVT